MEVRWRDGGRDYGAIHSLNTPDLELQSQFRGPFKLLRPSDASSDCSPRAETGSFI